MNWGDTGVLIGMAFTLGVVSTVAADWAYRAWIRRASKPEPAPGEPGGGPPEEVIDFGDDIPDYAPTPEPRVTVAESLRESAVRIAQAERLREDLHEALFDFAVSLAPDVEHGRMTKAWALIRITRRAQRLAGPRSASAEALRIRTGNSSAPAPVNRPDWSDSRPLQPTYTRFDTPSPPMYIYDGELSRVQLDSSSSDGGSSSCSSSDGGSSSCSSSD